MTFGLFRELGDEPTPDDVEECLIFDLSDAGVSARSTRDAVILPDFSAGTEVVDLGDGQFQFFDPSSLLLRTIGFEYDDGLGLTSEEVAGVVVGAEDYIFIG